MEVQLFEDPVQDGIELYDETYHFHASQIDEVSLFYVKCLLSSSTSVVLTVKVVGLIVPPLDQMTSTKACYKLGLSLFVLGTCSHFEELKLSTELIF